MKKSVLLIFVWIICGAAPYAQADDERLVLAQQAFGQAQYSAVVDHLTDFLKSDLSSARAAEAHQLLGQAYFLLGETSKSLIELRLAQGPPGSPPAAESLYWMGEAFLKSLDFPSAREHFQQMLDRFPASPYAPYALYSIGWAYLQEQSWTDALSYFRTVALKFPGGPLRIESQFRVGECLLHLDRTAEATRTLEIFTETYPIAVYVSQAHALLGLSYFKQARYPDAIAAYKKAVEASQGSWTPMAKLGLASAHFAMQEHEAAVEVLQASLRETPEQPLSNLARLFLANALLELGQVEEADQQLKTITEHPSAAWSDQSLLWQGEIASQQNRLQDAIIHFTQMLHRYPKSKSRAQALYGLAWGYMQMGQPTSAILAFQRAASEQTDIAQNLSARLFTGHLLANTQNNPEVAIQLFDQILRFKAQSPRYASWALYQVASLLATRNQPGAAQLALESLLTQPLDPPLRIHVLYHAGLAHLRAEHPRQAIERFEQLLNDPEISNAQYKVIQTQAQLHFAQALNLTGQTTDAARLLRKLIRNVKHQDPLRQTAMYRLGQTLHRGKKYPEAMRVFQEYLDQYPQSPSSIHLVAWMAKDYHRNQQPKVGLKLLNRMLKRLRHEPPETLAPLRHLTGELYFSIRQKSKALGQLGLLLRTTPKHPEAVASIQTIVKHSLNEPRSEEVFRLLSETARAHSSDYLGVVAWEALGTLQQAQGQYRTAVRNFKQGLRIARAIHQGEATLGLKLATCYEEWGNLERAIDAYVMVHQLLADDAPGRAQAIQARIQNIKKLMETKNELLIG